MNDIILGSLNNYNNFISFYKNSSHLYLINNEDEISNNNIYAKISKKQMENIYYKSKSKNLKYYIRGKFPIDIKILNNYNYIENALLLSSKDMNIINNVEMEYLSGDSFFKIFDKVLKRKNENLNITFKNCELKNARMDKIPFPFKHLKINNSKINYSTFNIMSFKNIVKLNLDNNQIDSNNFDIILNCLLEADARYLKEFTAKDNYISKIIIDRETYSQKNILASLKVLNLSNNKIYTVDTNILKFIRNIEYFFLLLDVYPDLRHLAC